MGKDLRGDNVMKYTTEKPKKPGWYWIKCDYIRPGPFVGEVYMNKEGFGLILWTSSGSFSLNAPWIKKQKCLWAGPIPKPCV